jgi:hypothetical protein
VCTVFIRFKRLGEIILRYDNCRVSLSLVDLACQIKKHAPEGRGLRCKRRARLLALCASAGNHTRCTCAAEPLGYGRRIRNGACAFTSWIPSWILWSGPAQMNPRRRHCQGCVSIRVPESFCHFHVVGSRTAWCLTYFSDEISTYSDRHLRISDRAGASVRSRSRVVAVT